MSIPEFTNKSRRRIGFLGPMPRAAKQALARRGYKYYAWRLSEAPDDDALSATECVVIVQVPGSFVRDELVSCIRALNFDCRVYLQLAGDAESFVKWERTRDKLSPHLSSPHDERRPWRIDASCFPNQNNSVFAPYVHAFTASSPEAWEDLATLIGRNPAGPAPNQSLLIEGASDEVSQLNEEQRLLLERAFYDCLSIRLIRKSNGLSGVGTYEVHALLNETEAGSGWPYRFFVKLGDRGKVLQEYKNYRSMAMENVPYHLGPRLRLERCGLGATQGLIVCDYVSGAEPLRDCARGGRGATAIANLFNQTLWAWRRAAVPEPRPLRESLLERLDCYPPKHRQPLYERYGAKSTIDDLKDCFKHCTSTPVLTGVVHGDLHATNVLVRQGDAVIIDLEKVESAWPLVFDAASLEGGLLIDGFIEDSRPVEEILDSIANLYTMESFRVDDHYCDLHSGSNWFFDSVRQIRMQARQLELGGSDAFQYAWTLAAVLMRKACNEIDFTLPRDGVIDQHGERREQIRAMAYVIAEKILRGLNATPAEGAPT